MHLLFITRETHPSHRADIAVLFGKYLPRLGVTSDLVAQRAGGADVPWGGGQALVARRSRLRVLNVVLAFIHVLQVLARGRVNYDAIQVRDNPLAALVALVVARRWGIPLFYWMSFPIVEGHLELAKMGPGRIGWLRYLFALTKGHTGRVLYYRLVAPRADHIFVQSEQMKRDMVAKGIAAEKLTPVPMGVDTEAADPARIAPSDDPRLLGRRVVVHLGSLDRTRRIDLMIEMLALAVRKQPDLVLVLMGDAPEAAEGERLRRLADELGVSEHIIWTGWLPMQEAWRYVRAAEVGLSPIPRGPLYDCASPTKATEYLALGVPVLANDLPDQAWLLEQSGGGVSVPFEPQALAAALLAMLADPEELHRMGRHGQAFVASNRSYASLAAALAEKYGELMRARELASARKGK
jgi:glycosyltransferase involved in cell wall biosynthesis